VSRDLGTELVTGLLSDLARLQSRNTDEWRYPAGFMDRLRRRGAELLYPMMRRRKLERTAELPQVRGPLEVILGHLPRLQAFHSRLADGESRRTLQEVLRFRILGRTHVRLRQNNDEFWRLRSMVTDECRVGSRPETSFGYPLFLYRVKGAAAPIEGVWLPVNTLNTFLLKQYRCPRAGVEAREGDIVVDGGGCWGDTALYFADLVGPGGRVHCFECVTENLDLLRENLARNPLLAPRIVVDPRALWREPTESLDIGVAGHSSSVMGGEGPPGTVKATSLDSYLEEAGLQRIDFLKLDVEGAEPDVLEGGRRTIQRHRPALAISVYHKLSDFWEIPELIDAIQPGYRFFLDHFSIHADETVLFARHESRPGA
jgi:FkbM family methyltransferase